MADPELKYYTATQVRDWLQHGTNTDGLSDKMIARHRGWAIVNNPYVKDDDAILSVIVVDGEVAAYTACFPEILKGENARIWWLTTLSCRPEFSGQGFGLIVVGQLVELHEGESVLDMDGAEETVEICRMLGMREQYKTFYRFRNKAYSNTLKGQMAAKCSRIMATSEKASRCFIRSISPDSYSLRYISFVDDETYAFIREHSMDSMPRSQQMMNWILQYPFMQVSPLLHRAEKDLEFSSNISYYDYHLVQVWQQDKLIGVYALRNCPWGLALKCVYYAGTEYEAFVNQSIAEHVLHYSPKYFETCNEYIAKQMKEWGLFDTYDEIKKSFSCPETCAHTDVDHIQAWDGDMFV